MTSLITDIHGNEVEVQLAAYGDYEGFDEEYLLYQVAEELHNVVLGIGARIAPGHYTDFYERRIRGTLQGTAIEYNVSKVRSNIWLSQVDVSSLKGILEDLQKSERVVDAWGVKWSFWVNSSSLQVGGSPVFKNPRKLGGLCGWNYKIPTAYQYRVGCAAISLMRGLYKEKGVVVHVRNQYKREFMDDCIKLQNDLEFENSFEVSVYDLTYNFLKKYKQYRIVTLSYLQHCQVYEGDDFIQPECRAQDKKTIPIYWDMACNHFTYCTSPAECVTSQRHTKHVWCYVCATTYIPTKGCSCGDGINKKVYVRKRKTCDHCGENYQVNHEKEHMCYHSTCRTCKLYYKKDAEDHRCPLYKPYTHYMKRFNNEDDSEPYPWEKERLNLYVWDIESHLVPIKKRDGTVLKTNHFKYDSSFFIRTEGGNKERIELAPDYEDKGTFVVNKDGKLAKYEIGADEQVPNFVAWKNVFTGESYESYDFNEFVRFMFEENDGYNMAIAHNSSGYDTRLLFEHIAKTKYRANGVIQPVTRGTKFIQLKIGNTIFHDSLLHLSRSLNDLAKAFKLKMVKGYFPHRFNRRENLDYKGRIPDIEYFDLAFGIRKQEELDNFLKWYMEQYNNYDPEDESTWWVFRDELSKYCVNDVAVLAEIVKIYHTEFLKSIQDFPKVTRSPWFNPTMASHVHDMMIVQLHEGKNITKMNDEQLQNYVQNTWAVLEPVEHYYVKESLRGGRTDIRKFYYRGFIAYKDIQSHYPHVQLKNMYPVGTPTIEVHDLDYFPCVHCYTDPTTICPHTCYEKKKFLEKGRGKKLTVIEVCPQDLHEYVKNFDGVLTVDVVPNKKLYHPVLVVFDEEAGKSIAPLTKIIKKTFVSVELKRAVEMGYKITKIYRADRYKMAPSIWKQMGLLGTMYLNKIKNSGKAPPVGEERDKMRETFKRVFGIDLGTDEEMDLWEYNPVLKQIAKGPITAAWGKHAETVDHMLGKIFNGEETAVIDFCVDLLANRTDMKSFVHLYDDYMLFNVKENRIIKKPDLHKQYLPVATFVTAYARLYLWEELNKLGERVLMHDTDSIIYIYNPNDYDIPEGICLGDWETEDFVTDHYGIVEFVAIGPKSYSLKGGDGDTSLKCKGACKKYSHRKFFNHEKYVEMVRTKSRKMIEGKTDVQEQEIPQLTFDYSIGEMMRAIEMEKKIQFNPTLLKGDYEPENYQCYPFGYCQACKMEEMGKTNSRFIQHICEV